MPAFPVFCSLRVNGIVDQVVCIILFEYESDKRSGDPRVKSQVCVSIKVK
jgi:hypothetical protein